MRQTMMSNSVTTSEVEVGPPARNSRRPKWEFTSGSSAMNTQKDSVLEPKGSPP